MSIYIELFQSLTRCQDESIPDRKLIWSLGRSNSSKDVQHRGFSGFSLNFVCSSDWSCKWESTRMSLCGFGQLLAKWHGMGCVQQNRRWSIDCSETNRWVAYARIDQFLKFFSHLVSTGFLHLFMWSSHDCHDPNQSALIHIERLNRDLGCVNKRSCLCFVVASELMNWLRNFCNIRIPLPRPALQCNKVRIHPGQFWKRLHASRQRGKHAAGQLGRQRRATLRLRGP